MHHRKSIRLKGYDYTLLGAYFVTIVTYQRQCIYGVIRDREISPSPIAQIVSNCWQRLPAYFPIRLDEWVVMPNHFHGIIVVETPGRGEAAAKTAVSFGQECLAAASPLRPSGTVSGSLGAILQCFKSSSTRQINNLRKTPGAPLWQRNYYERIIRDEAEWDRIRLYIQTNPLHWEEDEEYAPL